MTNATAERGAAPARRRRWASRRNIAWCLVGLVVIALLATGGFVGWRYRHPTVFYPASIAIGTSGRMAIGRVNYIGMTYPLGHPTHPVTLHVDGVSPRVAVNSADASVAFFVCKFGPHSRAGAIGSEYASDIRKDCPILVPASNVDMTVGGGVSDQIVMRIELRRPGTVLVDGMDLHYSVGWQHGWQWVGETARFTALSRPSG